MVILCSRPHSAGLTMKVIILLNLVERSKFAESAPTIKVKVTRALISKGKAIGKMDPYCKVHYGCDTYNTGVDKNGDKTPAWKNSIFFL